MDTLSAAYLWILNSQFFGFFFYLVGLIASITFLIKRLKKSKIQNTAIKFIIKGLILTVVLFLVGFSLWFILINIQMISANSVPV
ncbi:hypothetical protein HOH45_00945 [bacterium]|mgnify:CR=1|jgi:hypothetical protein|nr:hypothetical protein [bacterium]